MSYIGEDHIRLRFSALTEAVTGDEAAIQAVSDLLSVPVIDRALAAFGAPFDAYPDAPDPIPVLDSLWTAAVIFDDKWYQLGAPSETAKNLREQFWALIKEIRDGSMTIEGHETAQEGLNVSDLDAEVPLDQEIAGLDEKDWTLHDIERATDNNPL